MRDSDDSVSNASRYDLLLAAIPVAFVAGMVAAWLGWIPARQSLVLASVVGLIAVVDALFVHPPRPPARGRR